jgi:hypothetical protein
VRHLVRKEDGAAIGLPNTDRGANHPYAQAGFCCVLRAASAATVNSLSFTRRRFPESLGRWLSISFLRSQSGAAKNRLISASLMRQNLASLYGLQLNKSAVADRQPSLHQRKALAGFTACRRENLISRTRWPPVISAATKITFGLAEMKNPPTLRKIDRKIRRIFCVGDYIPLRADRRELWERRIYT